MPWVIIGGGMDCVADDALMGVLLVRDAWMRRLACPVTDWRGRGVKPLEPPRWRRISPASGSEHGTGEMSPPPGRSASERRRVGAQNGRARQRRGQAARSHSLSRSNASNPAHWVLSRQHHQNARIERERIGDRGEMAEDEAEVLVFEPAATRNTGNVVDETFTAPNGVPV